MNVGTRALALLAAYFAFRAVVGRRNAAPACRAPLTGACLFSEDYESARALFRDRARSARADVLESLWLDAPFDDLSVDVAVFKGDAHQKLLLHFSGVHGTEGYTGSAVQTDLLGSWKGGRPTTTGRRPTVVFVHGMNPYGMKNWRRVNEANVDLNRNVVFGEFAAAKARDPDFAGYQTLSYAFNPVGEFGLGSALVSLKNLVHLLGFHGMKSLKRALVTAQYHDSGGVFFGGEELQPSHKRFVEFLNARLAPTYVSELAILDVHTGLRPSGKDTIMVSHGHTTGIAPLVEAYGTPEVPMEDEDDANETAYDGSGPYEIGKMGHGDGANGGYEDVIGEVPDGFALLFPYAPAKILVTQEFGTYPNVLVGLSMMLDNQVHRYTTSDPSADPASRWTGAIIYEMFNPSSRVYKETVVARGRAVFEQTLEMLTEGITVVV